MPIGKKPQSYLYYSHRWPANFNFTAFKQATNQLPANQLLVVILTLLTAISKVHYFKSTHDPPGGEGAGAARDQDFYGWSRTFKSAPASQKFYAHSVHSLNFGLVY